MDVNCSYLEGMSWSLKVISLTMDNVNYFPSHGITRSLRFLWIHIDTCLNTKLPYLQTANKIYYFLFSLIFTSLLVHTLRMFVSLDWYFCFFLILALKEGF